MPRHHYSEKWQKRFEFFDRYGAPKSPEFREAFKAARMGTRMLINVNFIALFFGIIYFFILGLWKKNLVLTGIALGFGIVLSFIEIIFNINIPQALDRGIATAFALLWGMTANYAYYLKEVKGTDNWNPFEGMRLM